MAAYRRIGSAVWLGTGTGFVPFAQSGSGKEREYQYPQSITFAPPYAVVVTGTATAWTDVACSTMAPPTTLRLLLNLYASSTGGVTLYYRTRGVPTNQAAIGPGNCYLIIAASSQNQEQMYMLCDGAQCIQYAFNSAASGRTAYIHVCGYCETL